MLNIAYSAGFFEYSDPRYALHYLDRGVLVQAVVVAFAVVIGLWFYFGHKIARDRAQIEIEQHRGREIEVRLEEQLRSLDLK